MCLVLVLQYYVYELLDDGSNDTAQCPSAACPFAIVVFSYADTKAPIVAPQEKRYYIQHKLLADLIAFHTIVNMHIILIKGFSFFPFREEKKTGKL